MMRINPELPTYVEAGLNNPLGARAMYLYQGGHDILFRIHGTNEPWSIGGQAEAAASASLTRTSPTSTAGFRSGRRCS